MTEETHLCGSRSTTPGPHLFPGHDTWRVLPNGDRTCSFCGSAHPDDWLRIMRSAADPESKTTIDRSDKGYKFYCHQEGVSNALDGAIKFYTWHIPSDEWAAQANAIHADVMRESTKKMAERITLLSLRTTR